MRRFKKSKKGISLVELLISMGFIVAIIVVASNALLLGYTAFNSVTNDSMNYINLKSLENNLQYDIQGAVDIYLHKVTPTDPDDDENKAGYRKYYFNEDGKLAIAEIDSSGIAGEPEIIENITDLTFTFSMSGKRCSMSYSMKSNKSGTLFDLDGGLVLNNIDSNMYTDYFGSLPIMTPTPEPPPTPTPNPAQGPTPVPLSPPNPPKGLESQSQTDKTVNLRWEPVEGATGYNIYREGIKTPINETPISITTYSDWGLTPKSPYTYFVRAVNLAGESSDSEIIFVYTLPEITPEPTPAPTPTPTPIPEPIPTPISYFFDGFESNNFTVGVWTNSGTSIQTSYKYSDARAAVFDSSDYIIKSISTVGYSDISISYARMTTMGDSDDHFYVEWYNGSSWITLEDVVGSFGWTVRSYDLPADAGDNPNLQLRFRTTHYSSKEYLYLDDVTITATPIYNFTDGFDRSNNFIPGDWTSSGCDINTTYKYTGSSSCRFSSSDMLTKILDLSDYADINISYARMTNTCESDDHFIVDWSANGGSNWTTLEDLTGNSGWAVRNFSLPDTANNNPNFRLRFRTSHNSSSDYAYLDAVTIDGAFSPIVTPPPTPTPIPPPPEPKELQSQSQTDTTVNLEWTEVKEAVGYYIYNDAMAITPINEDPISINTFTVTGLQPEYKDTYFVRAVNSHGILSSPASCDAITKPSPPSAPSGLIASSVTTTSFNLFWELITGANSYNVYNGPDYVNVIGTPCPVEGLSPHTTYYFTVRAVNESGESLPSEVCEVTTAAVTPAPTPPPDPAKMPRIAVIGNDNEEYILYIKYAE